MTSASLPASSSSSSSAASDVAAAFATAMASGDVETGIGLLADDVEFHSPVVHAPYQGRDTVGAILRAVATVFEDFAYGSRYEGPDGHVLAFSARVGDRRLEGVDIIGVGEDGRIASLTVMVRPYSAATALRERMAALLT